MPPSGIGTGLCKSPGAKGGASTTLYPPAGRPPDHAPHLCKTAQRADSESRAWKASLLCTVAEHLDVRKWPPKMWGIVRATARVPTPLYTAPALTMRVIITHIFLGSLVERNYRAELVHKRYHAKCLVTSVHRNAPKDMGNDDTMRPGG